MLKPCEGLVNACKITWNAFYKHVYEFEMRWNGFTRDLMSLFQKTFKEGSTVRKPVNKEQK